MTGGLKREASSSGTTYERVAGCSTGETSEREDCGSGMGCVGLGGVGLGVGCSTGETSEREDYSSGKQRAYWVACGLPIGKQPVG